MSSIWKQNDLEAYIDNYRRKERVRLVAHGHEGYELLYYIEGSVRIRLNNRWFSAGPGDLVIFHPRVVHREYEEPGINRKICLRFKSAQVAQAVSFPPHTRHNPVVNLPWKDRFQNIFEQIVLEHKGVDKWSKSLISTYMAQFLVLLWRALKHGRKGAGNPARDHHQRVGQVIDTIHRNVTGELSLASLAATACMSQSHFAHVFKQIIGQPPRQYIIQSRIEKARELLGTTSHSARTIGRMLGWSDPVHFNRIFKKECGLTPGEYRKSVA